jgi:hypothetical protein
LCTCASNTQGFKRGQLGLPFAHSLGRLAGNRADYSGYLVGRWLNARGGLNNRLYK